MQKLQGRVTEKGKKKADQLANEEKILCLIFSPFGYVTPTGFHFTHIWKKNPLLIPSSQWSLFYHYITLRAMKVRTHYVLLATLRCHLFPPPTPNHRIIASVRLPFRHLLLRWA